MVSVGDGDAARRGALLPISDFIGVDLGVVNLATTSDAETSSGEAIEACRTDWYHRRRQRLQRASHVAQMAGKRPKIFVVPSNAPPGGKPPFAVTSITSSVRPSLRLLQTPCVGLPWKT